jgi:hypothetical protein
VGGGWLESVDNHSTTTVGDNKRQERATDDDGNDEEGEGGKGDGDGNEGSGQRRGQGRHGPWRQRWG